jgi:predicted DNA-binding protein (MmcQ/YjbR family)
VKLEPFRKYLLKKKGSIEETPFGPESLVFKVMGKMFALLAWNEDPLRVTLKCDPDLALALRAQYKAVQPGYYMNKDHWNTITFDGSIEDKQILEMIDESYKLVVRGLKKADQQTLQELEQNTG